MSFATCCVCRNIYELSELTSHEVFEKNYQGDIIHIGWDSVCKNCEEEYVSNGYNNNYVEDWP